MSGMPGMPGGRRHTDPPPFIPDLDQQYHDGSSSPEKNKDKDKDASRFTTFSWKKGAMDADIEAEEQAIRRAKAKMEDDFPVVAELVTSSDISDKYTLYNLSHALSHLYNRPQSSITISLFYTAYLLHDHTLDPSYILTISAPPALCQAHDNDCNAVAMAQFLDEALAVPPRRGTIKFLPMHLSCLAVGGRTLLGVLVEQVQADRAARDLLGVAEQQTRGRRSISSLRGLGLRRSRRGERTAERGEDRDEVGGEVDKEEVSGEGGMMGVGVEVGKRIRGGRRLS
ncbi:hypothetical protein GMDG_06031 [Pseudogymnoascus destructans 20631-21]|uniref:Uncharacterized protein n=1 Tax=Pseudogymnoascus destructans (strain ATCC MYA-4855 / 20631-21) TaxID=658429 RepID=L8FS32_PSED2|nr:hypothetical protein GMDG_06031 [Pseudogymnoascus destructans 20631-21]